ncbi:MAG: very short patch repair endonuclease [Lachnospiraceae bacterium]|jgi:DNA mismatch endonuclease (patch repair protein)|uniref:very short patch repair endonuclease n=1 Tax=Candidatus Merdisoma sp. JLR.KK006 TaxID=3112626 RepID=UPI002FF4372B|nr:very short patch repair endonuclease [Lachnospiraceae bacterium]
MDVLNKEQRHKAMSHIKSKDTRIELALRKELWSKGYRYRKNYKALPGTPDIVLTKYKIVIFCDGELFHGNNWQVLRPKLLKGNNPEYWVKKIERNMKRDRENDKKLLFMGWTVIRFWGNDILKKPEQCVKVIEEVIFDHLIDDCIEL